LDHGATKVIEIAEKEKVTVVVRGVENRDRDVVVEKRKRL
jgi:hypothetical protein